MLVLQVVEDLGCESGDGVGARAGGGDKSCKGGGLWGRGGCGHCSYILLLRIGSQWIGYL